MNPFTSLTNAFSAGLRVEKVFGEEQSRMPAEAGGLPVFYRRDLAPFFEEQVSKCKP